MRDASPRRARRARAGARVFHGSPALDWIDSGLTYPIWRTVLRFKGWSYETFKGLRTDVSRKRTERLNVPEHIKIVRHVGLSLSCNTSKFGEDMCCLMHSDGSSDGLGMLPEMVVPGSYTIIAPNSDHFLAEDPLVGKRC